MPSLVPKLVGDPRFHRYVIVDRSRPRRRYWTGTGWSRSLGKAVLFADIDDLNRTIASLYADLLR